MSKICPLCYSDDTHQVGWRKVDDSYWSLHLCSDCGSQFLLSDFRLEKTEIDKILNPDLTYLYN